MVRPGLQARSTGDVATGPFGEEWFAELARVSAADDCFMLAAKRVDLTMGLLCDTDEHWVRIDASGMRLLSPSPLGTGWEFALMASSETWRRVCAQVPPPLYADIFSLILKVPDCFLLGDRLRLMQSIGAVQRLLHLFRTVR